MTLRLLFQSQEGEASGSLRSPGRLRRPHPYQERKNPGGEIIGSTFDYSFRALAALAKMTASSTFSIARRSSLPIGQ
jgi:hypothetical protein